MIFGNKVSLVMYSKRQNSVQTRTFGSEFLALRQAVELMQALRYTLRLFGIPLDGPANVYCDNEVVNRNVSFGNDKDCKRRYRNESSRFIHETFKWTSTRDAVGFIYVLTVSTGTVVELMLK